MSTAPDQPGHAAQRPDVVVDVLEHVVADEAGVVSLLGGREQDLLHIHVGIPGHLPLQADDHGLVRVGHRELLGQRDPFPRVVAQPAAYLDRAVAQVGPGEASEPLPVVPASCQRDRTSH
jgi:hypothetical protein